MFYYAITKKMKQITDTILMIEPIAFRYNEQTAVNNYYQQVLDGLSPDQTQKKALSEFNAFVDELREKGINVIRFYWKINQVYLVLSSLLDTNNMYRF